MLTVQTSDREQRVGQTPRSGWTLKQWQREVNTLIEGVVLEHCVHETLIMNSPVNHVKAGYRDLCFLFLSGATGWLRTGERMECGGIHILVNILDIGYIS